MILCFNTHVHLSWIKFFWCSSTLDNSITHTHLVETRHYFLVNLQLSCLLPGPMIWWQFWVAETRHYFIANFAIDWFDTRTNDLVTSLSYFPQTHKLIGTSQCNSYWALPNNSWSKIVDAIQISDCIDFILLCDWTKIMKLIA